MTITEIVSSQRPSGATLLRITIDKKVGKSRIRHRREPTDPSRHMVVFEGIELWVVPPTITTEVPNLRSFDLSQHFENGLPELWIDLLLSSEQVGCSEVAFRGRHLVIVLDPPGEAPTSKR